MSVVQVVGGSLPLGLSVDRWAISGSVWVHHEDVELLPELSAETAVQHNGCSDELRWVYHLGQCRMLFVKEDDPDREDGSLGLAVCSDSEIVVWAHPHEVEYRG